MSAPHPSGEEQLPASGSSFYLGMRILPKREREAMYAIYAFCRAVDDVADSPGPRPERKAALEEWRRDVDSLYDGGDLHPNVAPLAPFIEPFGLQRQSFHDVIDGMEMDVDGDIQAPDWATLDLYCDRVASAVGRLSARVFGLENGEADLLAHHLGRALQLTNILRDIDEDAEINRLYLPREALLRAGIPHQQPKAALAHPALPQVCAEVAERAASHYDEADRVMARHPARIVRAPRIMEAAYSSVLQRLVKRGFAAPRARVRTGKLRVLLAVLRYGFA
ncbi:MAG: hpnD [Enterovirga sp.]|nr:hpnD [Enterovirga sp.]